MIKNVKDINATQKKNYFWLKLNDKKFFSLFFVLFCKAKKE